jgi:hypothetical protein
MNKMRVPGRWKIVTVASAKQKSVATGRSSYRYRGTWRVAFSSFFRESYTLCVGPEAAMVTYDINIEQLGYEKRSSERCSLLTHSLLTGHRSQAASCKTES